jgi:hypothetical protein
MRPTFLLAAAGLAACSLTFNPTVGVTTGAGGASATTAPASSATGTGGGADAGQPSDGGEVFADSGSLTCESVNGTVGCCQGPLGQIGGSACHCNELNKVECDICAESYCSWLFVSQPQPHYGCQLIDSLEPVGPDPSGTYLWECP